MLDRNELEINDEFIGLFEKWVCDIYTLMIIGGWTGLTPIMVGSISMNIQRMTLSCGLILRFILKITTTSGMTQR